MGGINLDELPGPDPAHKGRAAQIIDRLDALARVQAARNFQNLPLGIAKHQQVGLGIEQHRAAHVLGPIVEVRNTAQRGLDSADDDGYIFIGFTGPLCVNDHRAIRSLATLAARRVGIITANAPIGRVAIDHGIHVAGGNAEKQPWPAQRPEGIGTVPIGLRNNANPQALRLQHPAYQRHAKTGVIHIGITTDQNDIALLPAERCHLSARHGQIGRGWPPGGCGQEGL